MTGQAKWWIPLIRGPLLIIRFLVTPLYSISFGWLDKRLAKRDEARLAADVKIALRFLFRDEQAEIIQNYGVPFPPAFDYAFVTVAVGDMVLRFSRGRGELGAKVAPLFAPSDWHDLSLVLGVIREDEELERRRFQDLWEVSRILEPHLEALIEAFSPEKFAELKQRLETDVYRWDRVAIKEAEAEINWRVYGSRH